MKVCSYCGSSRNIEDEHIRAKSKRGKTTTPACQACNRSKGNKPLMEWFRWLKKNEPYRWNRIKNYNKRKRTPIAKKVKKIMNK